MAKYTRLGKDTVDPNVASELFTSQASSYNTVAQTQTTQGSLSASYLGGDYSAANQERVADNYVKSRYGSWSNAQSFWQANGWY